MRKIFAGREFGAGGGEPFEFTIFTATTSGVTSTNQQFRIPILNAGATGGGDINFMVDWGDGTIRAVPETSALHTYASAGVYTIKCYGNVRSWSFVAAQVEGLHNDAIKLQTIENWGALEVTEESTFSGCTNLVAINSSDAPSFSVSTTPSPAGNKMFNGCTACTVWNNISEWNVSGLQDCSSMFYGCSGLVGDLSNWDFAPVTSGSTQLMFAYCDLFDSDLSSWDMSNVQYFKQMFLLAQSFNNGGATGISTWDVSSSSSLEGVFGGAEVFNQPIGSWDTSNCTDMSVMFQSYGTPGIFNQSLSGWDVSNVTGMNAMFSGQGSFDQDISSWNVNSWVDFGSPTWFAPVSPFVLSQTNYDALLVAWDAYTYPNWDPLGEVVYFGQSKYTAAPSPAATAHASLIIKWGAISDGGPI